MLYSQKSFCHRPKCHAIDRFEHGTLGSYWGHRNVSTRACVIALKSIAFEEKKTEKMLRVARCKPFYPSHPSLLDSSAFFLGTREEESNCSVGQIFATSLILNGF